MKRRVWLRFSSMMFVFMALLSGKALSQGYGAPLTIQGLDRTTVHSASSRGMGGVTIGLMNDVGLMFTNPASLQSLKGIQLSIGGLQQHLSTEQVQHYGPLKYYSNFSLLMEGLTHLIPDPDSTQPGWRPPVNAGDTVQRPYDAIQPDWSRKKDQGLPIQALLGVPFAIGETRFVVGFGAVEYANLNWYYQNNNVLSPSILSERPIPSPRPPNDSLPIYAQWSQFLQSREGRIRGYGAALSIALSEKVSLGASGMILEGSTDDFEQHVKRGRLTFYTNFFRLDSVSGQALMTGRSEYKGRDFTISGVYRGRSVSVGVALKPPIVITRTYSTQVRVDTAGAALISTVRDEDKVRIPWHGTIGLSIVPAERLMLGLEYEIRAYSAAVYSPALGRKSNPWLSTSVFHVGAQFTPNSWLVLRGGIRGQAEVFEAEGNPIVGEPVGYSIYSAGAGIVVGPVRLNLAYEYARMKYQDVWGGAISLNNETRNTFIADIAYEIPWAP